jgi:hypothetical protein
MDIDPHNLPSEVNTLQQIVLQLLQVVEDKDQLLVRLQHQLAQLLRYRYGQKRERIDENRYSCLPRKSLPPARGRARQLPAKSRRRHSHLPTRTAKERKKNQSAAGMAASRFRSPWNVAGWSSTWMSRNGNAALPGFDAVDRRRRQRAAGVCSRLLAGDRRSDSQVRLCEGLRSGGSGETGVAHPEGPAGAEAAGAGGGQQIRGPYSAESDGDDLGAPRGGSVAEDHVRLDGRLRRVSQPRVGTHEAGGVDVQSRANRRYMEKFSSRALALVVNQVVFVLLMYSLLQWYWQRIGRPEFILERVNQNPQAPSRTDSPTRSRSRSLAFSWR